MDKKSSLRTLIFTIANLFLFISSIVVTIVTVARGTVAGQVDVGGGYGALYLITFTVQSNLLLGAVALFAVIFGVRKLIKNTKLPNSLAIWYLVAAASVMLTFLTVVLFLAPLRALSGHNYFEMLIGPMFFFHFLNPLLAAVIVCLFFREHKYTTRERVFALIPPAIYAVPYIINVVILKTWVDFYHFTFGGKDFLVIPVFATICLIVFGIASALATIHNKLMSNSQNPPTKTQKV